MTALILFLWQVGFDWHFQEMWDSVRPTIDLLLIALLTVLILQVKRIGDHQTANTRSIRETRDNVRTLTNGSGVNYDPAPGEAPSISPDVPPLAPPQTKNG